MHCVVKTLMCLLCDVRKTCVSVVNLVTSSAALVVYIIAFLKLISYQQVNRWCRDYFTQSEDRTKLHSCRRSKSLSCSSAKTGMQALSLTQLLYICCSKVAKKPLKAALRHRSLDVSVLRLINIRLFSLYKPEKWHRILKM